jgi:hypothetical protein
MKLHITLMALLFLTLAPLQVHASTPPQLVLDVWVEGNELQSNVYPVIVTKWDNGTHTWANVTVSVYNMTTVTPFLIGTWAIRYTSTGALISEIPVGSVSRYSLPIPFVYVLKINARTGIYLLEVKAEFAPRNFTTAYRTFVIGRPDVSVDLSPVLTAVTSVNNTVKQARTQLNSSIYYVGTILYWSQTAVNDTVKSNFQTLFNKLNSMNASLQNLIDFVKSANVSETARLNAIRNILNYVNATVVGVKGDMVILRMAFGNVTTGFKDVGMAFVSLSGEMAKLRATVLNKTEEVNVRLAEIIKGVTFLQNKTVVIETSLGTVKGDLVALKGDTAIVRTSLGNVEVRLGETEKRIGDRLDNNFLVFLGLVSGLSILTIAAVVMKKPKVVFSEGPPASSSPVFGPGIPPPPETGIGIGEGKKGDGKKFTTSSVSPLEIDAVKADVQKLKETVAQQNVLIQDLGMEFKELLTRMNEWIEYQKRGGRV